MASLPWKTPELQDFKFLKENLQTSQLWGSDCSIVNIFLLQKKYDIKIAIHEGILFRYYSGSENRSGYCFPLTLAGSDEGYLCRALSLIFEDAASQGQSVHFCLLTEEQKNAVSDCLAARFPDKKIDWQTNINDNDYIYEREKLAGLSGKTYHKKKNHVSRFKRIYDGRWEFRSLSLCQIRDDMLTVSRQWGGEHDAANDPILTLELESIRYALEHKDAFALEGGVLYTDGKPCAMTLASKISAETMDIHFEKCLKTAADDGAYAAINWCFASSCPDFKWFNREEDMGVEGLRKAKLSYHPQILLSKYYGEIV